MTVADSSKIDFFHMVPYSRNKVIATAKDMTMLYGEIEPGAEFPKHSHLHQQIGYCLKGKCELWIEGKTYVVKEGYTYSIPSDAKHSWRNIGGGKYVFVEVFYPARNDLLKGKFKEEFWEKKT